MPFAFPSESPFAFAGILNYVDNNVRMLARMYERRLKGYAAIGYVSDPEPFPPASRQ